MQLKLNYINTNLQPVSMDFDEQEHNWVTGLRVGGAFASPASAAQGILGAVEDIHLISKAVLVDDAGKEIDLPE